MAERRAIAGSGKRTARRGEPADDSVLSQTERAVEVIRDRIIDLTLPPGTKIDDQLLVKRFSLGRTPAREALNRLAAEGFVKIQRNKGAFVSPLELSHLRQFFDAYFAAERMIGHFCNMGDEGLVADLRRIQASHDASTAALDRLAITAANTDFHTRISLASGNEHIHQFCAGLHLQARRVSHVIYAFEAREKARRDTRRYNERVRTDHYAIIEAVTREDAAELGRLLVAHAEMFVDRTLRALDDLRGKDIVFDRVRWP